MASRTAAICGCEISPDYEVFGHGRCLACHQLYLFEKCNLMVVSCEECYAKLQRKKRKVWDDFQLELKHRKQRERERSRWRVKSAASVKRRNR